MASRFNAAMESRRDGYVISTDRSRLDMDAIWGFLRTSYWASGVARDVVRKSIEGSIPFGMYSPDGAQAGFARVLTDWARFAWLADVFVLEPHRGRGLGVWLAQTVVNHPDLERLRFVLGTDDAHGLYALFGFRRIEGGRMMERPGVN